jgi:hypothetical protein
MNARRSPSPIGRRLDSRTALSALVPVAVLGALGTAVAVACDTTPTSCAQLPEPECFSCPGSPPNVAICEQNSWVCPASGPCGTGDASVDSSPDTGPPIDATIPDGATDAAREGAASDTDR